MCSSFSVIELFNSVTMISKIKLDHTSLLIFNYLSFLGYYQLDKHRPWLITDTGKEMPLLEADKLAWQLLIK